MIGRIMGKDLKCKYGIIRPIMVSEYEEFNRYMSLLKKYPRTLKSLLFQIMVKESSDIQIRKDYKDELDNNELVYFIKRNDFNIKNSIKDMLDFIMRDCDDSIYDIILHSDEHWNEFREFVLKFNGMDIESESDDPEIRKFDNYSRALKEAKGQTVDFESIYTSILVRVGMSPEQINKLTIYQFYAIFRRVGLFFNYETTTLYKTVDSKGSINVVPWSSSTKKDKNANIKLTDFAKKFGNDFNK